MEYNFAIGKFWMMLYNFRPDALILSLVKDKLVLAENGRHNILNKAHNERQSGHVSTEKTYKRIFLCHYWPRCF